MLLTKAEDKGLETLDVTALDGNDLREMGENGYAESYVIPDEIDDLAALLAELPDSDRTELLVSIRTLIKLYRATVNGPKKC